MVRNSITFYVDPAWRRDAQHTPLLYPFWGNALDATRQPLHHALFERHPFDTRFYAITDDPEKADMVLMPYSYRVAESAFPELLKACHDKAQEIGKPLLIDSISDIEVSVPLPDTYVLSYGGYRFLPQPNNIHIPPYSEDLLELFCHGQLQLRKKSPKASLAFAGWAYLTPKQKLRTITKELPNRLRGIFDSRYRAIKKGVFFRRQAILIAQKSPLIETHFMVRTSYSGHIKTAEKSPLELQREFVDNLLESDYGLDVRGDPNTSTRLFEIAALGRIPVVLDTERYYPFSDQLDYASFCFMVDFRDIRQLPERLAEFHRTLTEERFQEMQKNARDAYLRYFRTDALMPHIIRELCARGALG